MAGRRCATCGAEVGAFADRCSRCGADPGITLIELGGGDDLPAFGRVGTDRRDARRARRWRPFLAVALVAWVAVALVGAVAGGGGGADDEEEATGKSVRESTSTTSTTSRRDRDRPTPGVTTTTIAVVEPLALGERTGLHLAAVAPGSLVDIDLDTGVVVEHELGVVVDWNASGVALVRSGALVWRPFPLASAPAVTLAPIPSGFGEAWILEDGSGVWVGGDGQRVADAPSELSLLATDGSGPITTATIPADAYPFGVSGDRLVLGAAGRLYTIDRGGDVADVGSGFSLAMGSGYVVVRRCDESLRCGSDRVDLATGEAETLPGLSEFAGQRLGGGWVGPSGAVLFTAFGSDGGVFLADAAGTRRLVDPRQRITDVPTSGSISPDGRWVSVAGVGIAWVGPAAGGDGVHLEVPGGFVDGPALLLDGPAV